MIELFIYAEKDVINIISCTLLKDKRHFTAVMGAIIGLAVFLVI